MANAPWVKLALQLNGAGGATPISLSALLPSSFRLGTQKESGMKNHGQRSCAR